MHIGIPACTLYPDLALGLYPFSDRTSRAAFIHFTAWLAGWLAAWHRLLWRLIHGQRTHFVFIVQRQSSKTYRHMQARTRACKQTYACNLATALSMGYL